VTTAFVTLIARVDIVKRGKDKLEARHPRSEKVLGTAERRFGRGEEDWIGWRVTVGRRRELVDTVTAARGRLEQLASEALAQAVV
jgi:hypothetical protein